MAIDQATIPGMADATPIHHAEVAAATTRTRDGACGPRAAGGAVSPGRAVTNVPWLRTATAMVVAVGETPTRLFDL